MPDVIDLTIERAKRDGPHPQYVTLDEAGVPMFLFIAEFEHDGGSWGVDFWAYSADDAEVRLSSMRGGLTLTGQLLAEVEG